MRVGRADRPLARSLVEGLVVYEMRRASVIEGRVPDLEAPSLGAERLRGRPQREEDGQGRCSKPQ